MITPLDTQNGAFHFPTAGGQAPHTSKTVLCTNPAGETLYALMGTAWVRGEWRFVKHTLFATDRRSAQRWFHRRYRGRVHEAAVAPVVGFFVKDNHGDDLSA